MTSNTRLRLLSCGVLLLAAACGSGGRSQPVPEVSVTETTVAVSTDITEVTAGGEEDVEATAVTYLALEPTEPSGGTELEDELMAELMEALNEDLTSGGMSGCEDALLSDLIVAAFSMDSLSPAEMMGWADTSLQSCSDSGEWKETISQTGEYSEFELYILTASLAFKCVEFADYPACYDITDADMCAGYYAHSLVNITTYVNAENMDIAAQTEEQQNNVFAMAAEGFNECGDANFWDDAVKWLNPPENSLPDSLMPFSDVICANERGPSIPACG